MASVLLSLVLVCICNGILELTSRMYIYTLHNDEELPLDVEDCIWILHAVSEIVSRVHVCVCNGILELTSRI